MAVFYSKLRSRQSHIDDDRAFCHNEVCAGLALFSHRYCIAIAMKPDWTAEAEAKLKEIPFFVRPAARKKIEKFAQEAGVTTIDVVLYEKAKQKFNS